MPPRCCAAVQNAQSRSPHRPMYLGPLGEVAAAVERTAQRVVVVHGHALRRIILDEAQVGLRRVRGERAVRLALVKHRCSEEIVRVRVVDLVVLEATEQLAAEEAVEGIPMQCRGSMPTERFGQQAAGGRCTNRVGKSALFVDKWQQQCTRVWRKRTRRCEAASSTWS